MKQFHSLLRLAVTMIAVTASLFGCGGGDGGTATQTSPKGDQDNQTATQQVLNPATLTTVRSTDADHTKQSEIARLTELADAAEAQGDYRSAAAFAQAAMPLKISLESPLRGTIEIAEEGHPPDAIKSDMLDEKSLLLIARQIIRQDNPFDADEQVTPEQLALALANSLTVSPQTNTGEPPFTVIVECNSKQLDWDPTRNWRIARQSVDRSVRNFLRRKLEYREKRSLERRKTLEAKLSRSIAAMDARQSVAATYVRAHPGITLEDATAASKEVDTQFKIAKEIYDRHDATLTEALSGRETLKSFIASAPNQIETKTPSKAATELAATISNLEAALEYHLIELRRPETHEAVVDVRTKLKAAKAKNTNLTPEQRFDVTKKRNNDKVTAKVKLFELEKLIPTYQHEADTMRESLSRYQAMMRDMQPFRDQYAKLMDSVDSQKQQVAALKAELREVNDQLRSPTASHIRYIAAPPQFPSWTKLKSRLNALQQQAGQFNQTSPAN